MKTGIATTGGGARAVFTAGVLHALSNELKFDTPDVAVGCSGSAPVLAYYVAGHNAEMPYGDMGTKWADILTRREFVSFLRAPRILLGKASRVLDVDYLVDHVVKKERPLDVEAIRKSKTRLFLGATDLSTGKVRYFSNNDNMFEALRATQAIPYFYGEDIKIRDSDGVERHYIDGQISSGLEQNIQKAVDEGAERVLAVDTGRNTSARKLFLRLYALGRSEGLKKAIAGSCQGSFRHQKPEGVEVKYISIDDDSLAASSNSRARLETAFLRGYHYVMDHRQELSDFLGKRKQELVLAR